MYVCMHACMYVLHVYVHIYIYYTYGHHRKPHRHPFLTKTAVELNIKNPLLGYFADRRPPPAKYFSEGLHLQMGRWGRYPRSDKSLDGAT